MKVYIPKTGEPYMIGLIVVDYSQKVPLPPGAPEHTHVHTTAKRAFRLDDVRIKKVNTADLHEVWKERRGDSRNQYFDKHMGHAVGKKTRGTMVWPDVDCLICADNKVPMDEDAENLWSLPALKRNGDGKSLVFTYIDNTTDLTTLGRVAVACVPAEKYQVKE